MSGAVLPADLRIRAGGPDDGAPIAGLVVASFATYESWAGPGAVMRPDAIASGELRWAEAFTHADRRVTLAVEPGGRIVGVASWRGSREPYPDGEPVPGLAHLSALFIHPQRHGEGIGAALLEIAAAQMRAGEFVRAQLWAVEAAPSVAFYIAQGWAPDGRRDTFPEFVEPIPMIMLVREL